jgi:predicted dehydrogenase
MLGLTVRELKGDRMPSRLRAAVVGVGYWGPNLVRNLRSSKDWELAAICDREPDRARQVAGHGSEVRIVDHLDDVLDDDSIDAVVIATPAGTHAAIAAQVLEAGRHVMIEKPLAASYAEGDKLVQLAEQAGLVLMCDHTYCYTPAVQKIAALIAEGTLGDIQFVDSMRLNLGLVQQDVDVMWDLAPHDLSILDLVLPESARWVAVAAQGADPIGAGHACVAYLTLPLASGAIAHTHVNWLSPTKIRTMVIGGTRRTLVFDDLNPQQRLSIYDRGVDLADGPDLAELTRAARVSYRLGDMVAPALPEREALSAVIAEFADAIRDGRPPTTDGRSGLRVLQVLEAATRSLSSGGTLVPVGAES